jgi:hypothetical protein
MAIDPGIIGNVMVPQALQLPDVNALMQTRTAGMENIYKIETARQQQAQAEAAAQAAAQEDALVQALLPAYTYGIETGDMAGALDLVPPEMQASVLPYVQALEGKPPEQVRAALIGSLSSSKAGQEALAAMQRAATLGVQQGQLDVSRQRLALDAQPPQMTPYQEAQIALERDKLAAGGAKETAEENKQRLAAEKRAKDLDLAIAEVETVMRPGNLIDQSTGSYIGNLIDGTMATIGVGTPGYEANAKLAPIADLVLKMVPRFEGPQSNYDVQSYKDAAGNLADPTVPNNVKKAAAAEIVRLFQKYRDQFEYAPGETGPEGGADTNGDGVIDFNDLGD